MKKILFVVGGLVSVLVLLLGGVFLFEYFDRAMIVGYTKNENLRTVRQDWPGTPLDEKGRFVNHEFPFLPSSLKLLRWTLTPNPQKEEKLNDTARLEVKDPSEFLASNRDGMIWLGHASFLIRLGGKSILLDPVFGEPKFLKPLVKVPTPIDQIRQVDYILLSHDHRDHTDEASIRALAQKFPKARFLAGLRVRSLISDWVTPTNEIIEAGWYQQFLPENEGVQITFLPVRHWCRRGLFDTNHILWGGFTIEGAGQTIYFSGDSGYGAHYRETAEVFPKIDYFLVGIGAYKPRFMMEDNHNTPEEAAQAFVDAQGKWLVPMHYGRFDQADEPPSEPLKLLREDAERRRIGSQLRALTINEALYFQTSD